MSELQIGEQEYAEILITDADGGLLVSITDKDVIEEKNCKVVCVPADKFFNKGVKEIKLNGEIVDFIPVMEKGSHNLVEITMG